MLLLDKPKEKLSHISNVKFNLHSDNFWSSVSSVRADIGVLLVWEEVTSHGTAFWVSVSLPQFLLLVYRFITSICSFFCQINETKVQNKIYFDKSSKCWFVCEWKSRCCKYSWPPSEQSGGCSYSKEVGRVRAAVTFWQLRSVDVLFSTLTAFVILSAESAWPSDHHQILDCELTA